MQKVYILVSTTLDIDTEELVISEILGVFKSEQSAKHALSIHKRKAYCSLKIIEKDLID